MLVTSEAILAVIVGKRLSIETALDKGLIVIDGEPGAASKTRLVVVEAFVRGEQSTENRQAQPVRLISVAR